MFCPFCGNQNRGGKKFCRQCGRTIPPARPSVATSTLSPTDEINNFIQDSIAAPPQPLADSNSANNANSDNYHNPINNHYASAPMPQPDLSIDDIRTEEVPQLYQEYQQGNGAASEPAEPFNQLTNQLLPDTVDFPVLQSMPPFPGEVDKPVNGRSNRISSNTAPRPKPNFEASPVDNTRDSRMNGNGVDLHSAMTAAALEDLHEPTDEIDMLDDTMEKTAEVPVVTAPPAKSETSAPKTARAVPGFLSVVDAADGSLQLEQSRRMERITMSAAVVLALVGIAFLIWIFS